MNKILVVLALMFLTLAVVGAGCQPETAIDGTTDTGNGETDGTDAGTGEIGSGTDWCKEGSSWSWEGIAGEETAANSWIIKGLETFKGDTYCHVTIESTNEDQDIIMEYYFKQVDEEIADVWMIMKDSSGNVLQEVHATG